MYNEKNEREICKARKQSRRLLRRLDCIISYAIFCIKLYARNRRERALKPRRDSEGTKVTLFRDAIGIINTAEYFLQS